MTESAEPQVRVVIAEDEAIIRRDLREILLDENYDVVGECARGDDAVEMVRALRPDVVILDIMMPGIDGLEAARRINDERLAATLILTAFSQREHVIRARDAGALAYLVKPFQPTDLIPAIEVALGRHAELQLLHEQAATLEDIGTLPGLPRSVAEAVSSVGYAVGHSFSGNGGTDDRAWIFTPDGRLIDLNTG